MPMAWALGRKMETLVIVGTMFTGDDSDHVEWLQCGVYYKALTTIVIECGKPIEFACELLRDKTVSREWNFIRNYAHFVSLHSRPNSWRKGRTLQFSDDALQSWMSKHAYHGRGLLSTSISGYDHRTLEDVHDILAAVWRFRCLARVQQLEFPFYFFFYPGHRSDQDLISGWRWQKELADWEKRLVSEPDYAGRWLSWLREEVESWKEDSYLIRLVLKILTNQNQPAGFEAEASLLESLIARYDDVPWKRSLIDTVESQKSHWYERRHRRILKV